MDSSVESKNVSTEIENNQNEPDLNSRSVTVKEDVSYQSFENNCIDDSGFQPMGSGVSITTDTKKKDYHNTMIYSSSDIDNNIFNETLNSTKDDFSQEIPLNQMNHYTAMKIVENTDVSSSSSYIGFDPIEKNDKQASIRSCLVLKPDKLINSLDKNSQRSSTKEEFNSSLSIVSLLTDTIDKDTKKISSDETRKSNSFIKCLVKPEILYDAKLNKVASVEMRLSQLSDKVLEIANTKYSPKNYRKKSFKCINLKKISGEKLFSEYCVQKSEKKDIKSQERSTFPRRVAKEKTAIGMIVSSNKTEKNCDEIRKLKTKESPLVDENNNEIPRVISKVLEKKRPANKKISTPSTKNLVTKSVCVSKPRSPSIPKTSLNYFKIPKKLTEKTLPQKEQTENNQEPTALNKFKYFIPKLNEKPNMESNQIKSIKLTDESSKKNTAAVIQPPNVEEKYEKSLKASSADKFPTLKLLIKENNAYYNSLGCMNEPTQISLNFLIMKYLKKASYSDLNFLPKNAYSHLSVLSQPEQLELCKLMTRNSSSINVFNLYGIGSDLRFNQRKKEISYDIYGKYAESIRNEKPLEFSDSKDEKNFMCKAFEEMTMAELFVIYSRFKQKISSPFRAVQIIYDRERSLSMIRVRVEVNCKPESLEPSLEACVSYVLHSKNEKLSVKYSLCKDLTPIPAKIEVKNKVDKIEILKNKVSDEEFNRLYLMKYVDRLRSRPNYRFDMKSFFDKNGKFSLKTDDLKNYKLRKKEINFKPPTTMNQPRFENFISALFREKDHNSFRGHMRKAERLTEMTQREYNHKMDQINHKLDSDEEINLTQLFDLGNSTSK